MRSWQDRTSKCYKLLKGRNLVLVRLEIFNRKMSNLGKDIFSHHRNLNPALARPDYFFIRKKSGLVKVGLLWAICAASRWRHSGLLADVASMWQREVCIYTYFWWELIFIIIFKIKINFQKFVLFETNKLSRRLNLCAPTSLRLKSSRRNPPAQLAMLEPARISSKHHRALFWANQMIKLLFFSLFLSLPLSSRKTNESWE